MRFQSTKKERTNYSKITVLQVFQEMKPPNAETGKNIAVLNYRFYCIINLFMNTVRNTKFQSFQQRQQHTKPSFLPPMTSKEIRQLLLRHPPGHNNAHLVISSKNKMQYIFQLTQPPKKTNKKRKKKIQNVVALFTLPQAHHPTCSAYYTDSP